MARLSLVESLRKARSTDSLKEAGSIARSVRADGEPTPVKEFIPRDDPVNEIHNGIDNDTTEYTANPTPLHPPLHRSPQRHNEIHNETTPCAAQTTANQTTENTPPYTSPYTANGTAPYTTLHESFPGQKLYDVTDKVAGLSGKKAEIFASLVANRIASIGGCAVVNLKQISVTTQISYNTVRAALCDFQRLKFIEREDFRNGSYQGVKVTFLNKADERFLASRGKSPTTEYTTVSDARGMETPGSECATLPTPQYTTGQATPKTTNTTAPCATMPTTCSKIDRSSLNILSIQNAKFRLLDLTNRDISFHWPALANIGFDVDHIHRIVASLEKVGHEPDGLFRAFDYVEFELNDGGIKGKNGELVKSPAGYVYNALARTGRYRKPPGYQSPEELAEIEKQEELRRLLELRKQTEELEFETWKLALSLEELAEVRKGMLGPEGPWMRNYWRKHVKDKQL